MEETYREMLCEYFPTIDNECTTYVIDILSDKTSEIETADDLYDAIGGMLEGLDGDMSTDRVKHLCSLLNDSRHGHSPAKNAMKTLDIPLQMSTAVNVAEDDCDDEQLEFSMFNRKKGSSVDLKKLEKAEAKLKEKQQKRVNEDVKVPVEIPTELPSASQQNNRRQNYNDASSNSKSRDIHIENFDLSYGSRTLLQAADLHMAFGRRYGLVGRNGIGKTTLLRSLATKGLKLPPCLTVLHVEQEVVGNEVTALDSVLECDTERQRLLDEEKRITSNLQLQNSSTDSSLSVRLDEVYASLQAIEADKAPARAGAILAGLGFNPKDQHRPTREFSGGWRMRLALARALFAKPDLLLLDEPTNMLDMKAVIWLENYLQNWPSTILVVSHDREFLNYVATDILHLRSQKLEAYRGNYEVFHKTRAERLKNQLREYEAQKQYRDHIQVFIDRFRYNANRASQVQSKLKLLEKLPELTPPESESETVFRFPDVEKLSPPVLQLDEVCFHYVKEKPIFKKIDISANSESRICVVGENGAGKTTLLKLLLGELSPVSGIRHSHRCLSLGYFSQHHVDQLDMNGTSVEVLESKFPGKTSEFYRGQLGKYGLSGELALRPVASLSGGQKSRVAFTLMSMSNPNFLILDEPTNHLDMETIEALGDALAKFQGGVILVSHDERLIRVVCNELWICGNLGVRRLDGDGIDDYKKIVEAEIEALN